MNVVTGEPGVNRQFAGQLTRAVVPVLLREVGDVSQGRNDACLIQIGASGWP